MQPTSNVFFKIRAVYRPIWKLSWFYSQNPLAKYCTLFIDIAMKITGIQWNISIFNTISHRNHSPPHHQRAPAPSSAVGSQSKHHMMNVMKSTQVVFLPIMIRMVVSWLIPSANYWSHARAGGRGRWYHR